MSPIFNHIPISHEVHVKIKSLRAKRFRAEIKVLDSDCRATLFSSDFSMNPNTLITVLAEDVVNSLEIKKIQEGDSIQYMEFIET